MYFIFLNEKYHAYTFGAKQHVICYHASLLKSIRLYERQYSELETKYDISRWHSVEYGRKNVLISYPIGIDNNHIFKYRLIDDWKEYWDDV